MRSQPDTEGGRKERCLVPAQTRPLPVTHPTCEKQITLRRPFSDWEEPTGSSRTEGEQARGLEASEGGRPARGITRPPLPAHWKPAQAPGLLLPQASVGGPSCWPLRTPQLSSMAGPLCPAAWLGPEGPHLADLNILLTFNCVAGCRFMWPGWGTLPCLTLEGSIHRPPRRPRTPGGVKLGRDPCYRPSHPALPPLGLSRSPSEPPMPQGARRGSWGDRGDP